jgi:hypothetical protein
MLHSILGGQERRSLLFGEMMRRFAFDPHRDFTMSEVLVLSRAINRCRACGAAERCARWMAETTGTDAAEGFCPNAAAFRRLSPPSEA